MILIQGSSRTNGNSSLVSSYIELNSKFVKTIHLSDIKLNPFSYNGISDDDFLTVIHELVSFKDIIFITPVYWYTMSGLMKIFLDRFTDLLKWEKDLGRQLRGKNLYLISNSSSDDAPEHFQIPFSLSADYLGMNYKGYCHTIALDGSLTDESIEKINSLLSI